MVISPLCLVYMYNNTMMISLVEICLPHNCIVDAMVYPQKELCTGLMRERESGETWPLFSHNITYKQTLGPSITNKCTRSSTKISGQCTQCVLSFHPFGYCF